MRRTVRLASVVLILTSGACDKYDAIKPVHGVYRPARCVTLQGIIPGGWITRHKTIHPTVCQPLTVNELGLYTYGSGWSAPGVRAQVARLEFADAGVLIETEDLRLSGTFEYRERSATFSDWKRHNPIYFLMLTILFLIAILGTAAAVISARGELAIAHENVNKCRSNIITGLQKRFELLTGLFTIALRYEEYERQMVTQAGMRMSTSRAVAVVNQMAAYPQLRANETYQTLMGQLSTAVNEVERLFHAHNDAVAVLNARLRSISGSVAGATLGISGTLEMLDSSQADRLLPRELDLSALRVIRRR